MQKQFNLFMVLGFVIFTGFFVFLLTALNPDKGLFVIISFYLSLTFAIICFASLIGYRMRKKATNNEIHYSSIRVSMREAFLLALFFDGLLALGSIRLLTWWDALLLAATLILLELYLQSSATAKKLKRDEEIIL
jgi:hypothetical protein